MKDRNKKYYTFALILYRDSLSYDFNKVISYIEKNWTTYAWIVHEPDEEVNKEHVHVLVHFDNKRYISAIAKELNIGDNYIQPCNLVPYLRYLIHFDNEEKTQYSPYEVHGSLQPRLLEVIKTKRVESEEVAIILSYISDYTGTLQLFTLTQFVLSSGVYSTFRRNYIFFKDLVLEHNKLF